MRVLLHQRDHEDNAVEDDEDDRHVGWVEPGGVVGYRRLLYAG